MFSVPSYSDMTCQPTGAALSLPFPDQLAQRRAKDQYQKSIRGNSAEQPSLRWVGGRSVDCWDCWAVAVQRGPQGRAKRQTEMYAFLVYLELNIFFLPFRCIIWF